jgi:hypothetical protein
MESIFHTRVRLAIAAIRLPAGYQRLLNGPGSIARLIDRYRPDRAGIDEALQLDDPPPANRCPGEIKCSWNWGSEMQNAARGILVGL